MEVFIAAMVLMLTQKAAFDSTAFVQNTLIGELDPICIALCNVVRLITSYSGRDVFFKIDGVRYASNRCVTAINRLYGDIQYVLRTRVYDPIVNEIRDELILLSGALGFTIPDDFMCKLQIARQYRLKLIPMASFVKYMAIVCAIALTDYDLSQCTENNALKTVPTLREMFEMCGIYPERKSGKYSCALRQIIRLFKNMCQSHLHEYIPSAAAKAAKAAKAAAATATATKAKAKAATKAATKSKSKAATKAATKSKSTAAAAAAAAAATAAATSSVTATATSSVTATATALLNMFTK